jgi:DNA-binding beta-propeller fold protein YncE
MAVYRIAFVAAIVAAAWIAPPAATRPLGGTQVALVTAESENELIAVSLPDGKVLRRVRLASDPETIAAGVSGPAIVVSPRSGTVTILAWRSLRTVAVLRGFRTPKVAAITPDGEWAYVTDSATGDLSVIELARHRVVDRLFVGAGAHHLAISPDGRRTWVALSESATTIVVLDTSNFGKPSVIGRFHAATPAHDLVFAPDGRSVWISSAGAPYVSILASGDHRLLGKVPAGPGPQHIVFGSRGHVYVTSGYGSAIELVDARTRKVLRRAAVPYQSFNVAAVGDIVVTSSLSGGTVTELNGVTLWRWISEKVAPRARGVALSVW